MCTTDVVLVLLSHIVQAQCKLLWSNVNAHVSCALWQQWDCLLALLQLPVAQA
jgi:hypothetical protein